MDPLEQRLIDLSLREAQPSLPPDQEQEEFPDRMGVTITEPMKISGVALMPGRYVFRLPAAGAESHCVEIFNEDETRLVAKISLGGLRFPTGLAGPDRSLPSSRKPPRS